MKIEIENLTYTYPGNSIPAIENVSLQIDSGECCAFIGKNGSGKSTLCLAIMGIIPEQTSKNYSGKVLINGMNPLSTDVFNADNPLGLVHENPRALFIGKNTVFEEVAIGLENKGIPREQMIDSLHKSGIEFGIEKVFYNKLTEISGGEEQKIVLACNSVIEPKLWIFDEPTTYLDSDAFIHLFEFISDLRKTGATVLIFDNRNLDYIADVTNRAFILHEGKLVAEGLSADTLSASLLDDLQIGTSLFTQIAKKSVELGFCDPSISTPITFDQARMFFERYTHRNSEN